MNESGQEFAVSGIENKQRYSSVCQGVPSQNESEEGMSIMKSTWNEGQFSDLHSDDDPIVVNIKTEDGWTI